MTANYIGSCMSLALEWYQGLQLASPNAWCLREGGFEPSTGLNESVGLSPADSVHVLCGPVVACHLQLAQAVETSTAQLLREAMCCCAKQWLRPARRSFTLRFLYAYRSPDTVGAMTHSLADGWILSAAVSVTVCEFSGF